MVCVPGLGGDQKGVDKMLRAESGVSPAAQSVLTLLSCVPAYLSINIVVMKHHDQVGKEGAYLDYTSISLSLNRDRKK